MLPAITPSRPPPSRAITADCAGRGPVPSEVRKGNRADVDGCRCSGRPCVVVPLPADYCWFLLASSHTSRRPPASYLRRRCRSSICSAVLPPLFCSLDALKWATKSLCNKDDEVCGCAVQWAGPPGKPASADGKARHFIEPSRSLLTLLPAPTPPSSHPQLHLISVLEAGGSLPNEVPGESAADSAPDCKPDPMALAKTQDLLQKCKGEATGAGIKNVKMTTLVSCVGGSADMVRGVGGRGVAVNWLARWVGGWRWLLPCWCWTDGAGGQRESAGSLLQAPACL